MPETYTVFALNGNERLPMDPATVQGDSLRIPMALFESELVAKIDGNTAPGGMASASRSAQPIQTLPFEAQYGVTLSLHTRRKDAAQPT